jgi:hypothetical protein
MNSTIFTRAGGAVLALAALMAATRFQHFGSSQLLPDASVAVFLLGGFYLARARWFALFFAEALVIDQLATSLAGISDWCITPAYGFLLPAYGAAWLAGMWTARGVLPSLRGALRAALAFVTGVLGWFVISNAGFFLFAGYFDEMSVIEFASRVARYFPGYFVAAAAYVLLAAALHGIWHFTGRAPRRA